MKRRPTWKIGLILFSVVSMLLVANLESTTKQGIDYKVREFKIPLYLKSLDFIDRHLDYRWTVQNIIDKGMSDEEKAEAVFQWTIRHIARQPDQLPVIDDHVWHIIVRGYGVSDQLADVFATLCNYADLKAFVLVLKGPEGTVPGKIALGAVYFNDTWHICDPWQQTEFVNIQSRWASIKEIVSGNWKEKRGNSAPSPEYKYGPFFRSLSTLNFENRYVGSRSSIQSPVKRLIQMFSSKKNTAP